jgi:butyryl-CoA dehydrogenase
MGLYILREYGGAGMDYVSYAIAIAELSKYCASTGTIVAAHNSLCISPIYYFAQRNREEIFTKTLQWPTYWSLCNNRT